MHHQALEHVDLCAHQKPLVRLLHCNGACLLVPHEAEVNAMACHRCMLSWRSAGVVGVMPKTLLMPLMNLVSGVPSAWARTFCTSMPWAFQKLFCPRFPFVPM